MNRPVPTPPLPTPPRRPPTVRLGRPHSMVTVALPPLVALIPARAEPNRVDRATATQAPQARQEPEARQARTARVRAARIEAARIEAARTEAARRRIRIHEEALSPRRR